MDPATTPTPNTEPIPRSLEQIVYSSVEKAIRTLLLDQGYLRKRNRSRSHSRSRSRSHSRGKHGKPRSRSRSHSRGRGKHCKPSMHGKRMTGPFHFHHHHHFNPHPAELIAEEAWPRHEGWPRHKKWGKGHHRGHRFPFAGWSKRCQRGGEDEGQTEEEADGGEVVEIVDLVEGNEPAAENTEKDLQTGIEKMNVNDTNVSAEAQ